MEVVPERLCQLADTCLTQSQSMADGWSGAAGALAVEGTAAGNTAGGADLLSAHGGLVDAADIGVGRLTAVLEKDMDALYQCAFDFSCTDEAAAAGFETELSWLGRSLAD